MLTLSPFFLIKPVVHFIARYPLLPLVLSSTLPLIATRLTPFDTTFLDTPTVLATHSSASLHLDTSLFVLEAFQPPQIRLLVRLLFADFAPPFFLAPQHTTLFTKHLAFATLIPLR
mgnify:CR=1 FL=1